MTGANEKVILDFCAAWRRKDIGELIGFFAPDAVYHNIPMGPLNGTAAIREAFEMFVTPAEQIEFDVLAIASADDVVFTERIDRFSMMGKSVALPVAGVFVVRGGKIAAWRDYFDMQTWLKQTGAA